MTIYGIVAEGDSLTYAAAGWFYRGLGLVDTSVREPREANRSYITSPFVSSPDSIIATNYAVSGNRLVTHIEPRKTTVSALAPTSPISGGGRPTRKYILCILAGTNPDTSNPATHAASMASYLDYMKAFFNGIILGTLPSRTDGIIGSFDTGYAQPYNAIIKDSGWMAAHGVTAIADFAADPEIGGTSAANNATYFSDTVHPTGAGQVLMASRFATALTTTIAAIA